MTVDISNPVNVAALPADYPHVAIATATLLAWGHMADPPYNKMRKAAPWLRSDPEVKAYLSGVVESHVMLWKLGFSSSETEE